MSENNESMFKPEMVDKDTLELLVLLMEECGEVVQAASKCIRNIEYIHTSTSKSNLQQLQTEMCDLNMIMDEVKQRIGPGNTLEMTQAKRDKLSKWTNVFKIK